jgi:DNA-binding response OmpR family regulator
MHSKPKILLVDDEPDLLTLLVIRFKANDFDVIVGTNGEEALAALVDLPDIIILDAMMPPPDGFEVCRILRKMPEYFDTPVILLTAKCREEDRREAHKAGIDILIGKPYEFPALLKETQRLLSCRVTRPPG